MGVGWLQDGFKARRGYCEYDPRSLLTTTVCPTIHDVLIYLIAHGHETRYQLRKNILVLNFCSGRCHIDDIFKYSVEWTIHIYSGAKRGDMGGICEGLFA